MRWLDALLPPTCARCGAVCEEPLCGACARDLPWLEGPIRHPPRPLAACVAAVEFRGDVEPWVHRFKYPGAGLAGLDPGASGVAAWLVLRAAQLAPPAAPGRVVPVPLHPRRLRARGFNPAGRLARALARSRGLRLDPAALRRVRDTRSQTGLARRERRRNVRGAFRARRALPPGERVWLVDDVVTTGSTLSEAARALRRAGAGPVVGICLARTP